MFLYKHAHVGIVRHTKVKGTKSPFDGDWVYWSRKMGKHPQTPKRVAELLKNQKGKCPFCELYFRPSDLLEIHHKDRNRKNNNYKNLELLHRHCHDKVHGSMRENHRITEELDEVKVSRPVLKTSAIGDDRTEFI